MVSESGQMREDTMGRGFVCACELGGGMGWEGRKENAGLEGARDGDTYGEFLDDSLSSLNLRTLEGEHRVASLCVPIND